MQQWNPDFAHGIWISLHSYLILTTFDYFTLTLYIVIVTWLIVVGVGFAETLPCLWKMLAEKTWRWQGGPHCTYVQRCFPCFGKFKSQQYSSQILECPDVSLFANRISSFLQTLNQISFQFLYVSKECVSLLQKLNWILSQLLHVEKNCLRFFKLQI
jgi:hypothetical protein